MGAWDATVFGNDEAADFANAIDDLGDRDPIIALLRSTLTAGLGNLEYLDAFAGSEALAAAALVASWDQPDLLGDGAYGPESWPPSGGPAPADLRALAGQAIDRLLKPDENELYDLWADSGEWDAFSADIGRYRRALP